MDGDALLQAIVDDPIAMPWKCDAACCKHCTTDHLL